MLATESPQFDRAGGDPYPFVPYGRTIGFAKTLRGTVPNVASTTYSNNSAGSAITKPSAQYVNGTLPVGSIVIPAYDDAISGFDDQAIAGAESQMANVIVPVTADGAGADLAAAPDASIHGLFGVVTNPDGAVTGDEVLVVNGFCTVLCRVQLPSTETGLSVGCGLMYDFATGTGALTAHTAGTKCIGILAQEISGATASSEVHAYVRFNGTHGFGA